MIANKGGTPQQCLRQESRMSTNCQAPCTLLHNVLLTVSYECHIILYKCVFYLFIMNTVQSTHI